MIDGMDTRADAPTSTGDDAGWSPASDMTDVRINLLPREVGLRKRATRQHRLVMMAILVLLVVLAVVYWRQMAAIADAEEALATEQAQLDELAAEEVALAEFADLAADVEAADTTLAAALSEEVSFAAVLRNVALAMPRDAALETLDLTLIEQTAPDGDELRPVIGRITASGESLDGHAPGIEQLLVDFDGLAGFFDAFVTTSALDAEDEDVSRFTLEVDIGEQLRTGRYLDGIPEGLR